MAYEPLVSVGIPCYNRPEGLRRTLECITGQSYRNLEIIISDNCSPNPDIERIANEFGNIDNRVKFFRQPQNYGMSFNFKFVLEKATGEFFMWASDDDLWYVDHIKLTMDLFTNDNILAACNLWMNISPDGSVMNIKYPNLYDENRYVFFRNLFICHPWKKTPANYFYSIYRKEKMHGIFINNNVPPEFGQDLAFLLEVLCMGYIAVGSDVTWEKHFSFHLPETPKEYFCYVADRNIKNLLEIFTKKFSFRDAFPEIISNYNFRKYLICKYWSNDKKLIALNLLSSIKRLFF